MTDFTKFMIINVSIVFETIASFEMNQIHERSYILFVGIHFQFHSPESGHLFIAIFGTSFTLVIAF